MGPSPGDSRAETLETIRIHHGARLTGGRTALVMHPSAAVLATSPPHGHGDSDYTAALREECAVNTIARASWISMFCELSRTDDDRKGRGQRTVAAHHHRCGRDARGATTGL
jgi:hypothetical protein